MTVGTDVAGHIVSGVVEKIARIKPARIVREILKSKSVACTENGSALLTVQRNVWSVPARVSCISAGDVNTTRAGVIAISVVTRTAITHFAFIARKTENIMQLGVTKKFGCVPCITRRLQ